MAGQTHNIYRHFNSLGLYNVSTAEMFALADVKVGDVVFNTDIDHIAVYSHSNGWVDIFGNPIMKILFQDDFESGDFATRGWELANADTNKWVVGQAEKYRGSFAAYITNDETNKPAEYTINRSQISHLYKELTIPATATKVQLEYFWKGIGERNYDFGRLYILPGGTYPQANQYPDSQYLILSQLNQQGSWKNEIVDLADYIGQTIVICHTWRNDSSVGTSPGFCIDNNRVTYLD